GALLQWFGFTYAVPFCETDMPERVDLVVSRVVLEHIPPQALSRWFSLFRRRLHNRGMMAHVIDHSDHREHRDKSLSRIDFLRFSDRTWRLLCVDPQDYTNRMRHPEYIRLIQSKGFAVVLQQIEVDSRAADEARTMPLWGRFEAMSPNELAILSSHIIAQPVS